MAPGRRTAAGRLVTNAFGLLIVIVALDCQLDWIKKYLRQSRKHNSRSAWVFPQMIGTLDSKSREETHSE